jgi:hypothetical protein
VSNELLLSNIVPFAGSGLVGYAIGFAEVFSSDISLANPSGTIFLLI